MSEGGVSVEDRRSEVAHTFPIGRHGVRWFFVEKDWTEERMREERKEPSQEKRGTVCLATESDGDP